jgi:hypothetical protein
MAEYYAQNMKTGKKKDVKTDSNASWYINVDEKRIHVNSVGFYDSYTMHDSITGELVF